MNALGLPSFVRCYTPLMQNDHRNARIRSIIFIVLFILLVLVTVSVTAGRVVPAADLRFDMILYALRTHTLVRFAKAITILGTTAFVLAATALIFVILFAKKLRAQAISLAATVLGAGGIALFLKDAVGRARPPVAIHAAVETSFSFPSGHATLSMALYGFGAFLLCRRYPKQAPIILAAATLLILAIGFSRLYLGVHYPSDVLGGYLVGGLWIIIGAWLLSRLERQNASAIVE